MGDSISLKRKAKGKRPDFFEDPTFDKLLAMLMGLAGEVSIMRDRLDTIERIAEVLESRAERRETFLGEVTRILQAELEGLETENSGPYDQTIDLVESDRTV